MTELADNTKTSADAKPNADAKPPGDKIDPHVSQQQLGKNGSSTGLTDAPVIPSPNGIALDPHVSLQQLGQADSLKIVRDGQKPATTSALTTVEIFGALLKAADAGLPKPEAKPGDPAKAVPLPEAKRLTEKELEKIAEAIDNAANSGFLFGAGTDKDAINEQLKRVKDPLDKAKLDEIYTKRTGHNIEAELMDELSGSDLQKSMSLWKSTNVDAARVTVALTEHKEWGIGARTNATVERDLRDTISTLNSKQIAEMDQAFRADKNNNGKTLRDALLNDTNLPETTKKALEIYLEGTDKRTTAHTLKLADLAIQERNLDMFQEAFRDASPEARKAFADAGGDGRIVKAFGTQVSGRGVTTYLENDDCKQARDYLSKGHLDLDTKIKLNSGIINDNEEAIELAINRMTDDERKSYTRGRAEKDKPKEELTGQSLTDRDFYTRVNSALQNAGNEREMKKWEDLIEFKDGSLVTEVTKHGGIIDDSIGDVLNTIENMSEDNWKRLKENPEQLKRLQATLEIDLNESELKRANKLLELKLAAGSFKESLAVERPVTEALKDSIGFWNTSETGVLESISRMTKAEQQQYRDDPEFKKKVDAIVIDGMDEGLEQKSAFAMLDAITRGGQPEDDILSKLYVHADHFNTDETKVIEDLELAYKKDPTLPARLAKDTDFRAKFDEAIHQALDPSEYERYAKPIIESGRLPFAVKAELYQGKLNDDEQGLYEAISKGTEADFAEITANPQAVLPFLSDSERAVAVNIAEQKGEFRPEDKIRAAMLGAGTTETTIHEALKDLTPQQVEYVRAEYLRKYDSDMLGDTLDEMGGSDREQVIDKAGAQPQTARESYNASRDRVYQTVDGIGRAFVNNLDGTGAMTMDELNKYSTGMSSFAKRFEQMPLEQRTEFKSNLLKAKELYAKSENSAADLVVDGAIIGAGILGAKFTGGVSLSLLAYTSFGGALFKIGAKSAIVGNDYDFASADVFADGGSGAIDAVSIVLGPAQAANFLRLGERSAETAAASVLSQSKNLFEATGKQILKEGSEEALSKRIFQEVAVAISNGSEGVDEKVFAKIAKDFAANPAAEAQVKGLVQDALAKAVAEEGADAFKAMLRELALNSAAGNVGGGSSGFVYGLTRFDESNSAANNFYQLGQSTVGGAFTGTFMAAGFTAGIKSVGRGLKAFTGAEAPRQETILAKGALDHPTTRPSVELPQGAAADGAAGTAAARVVDTATGTASGAALVETDVAAQVTNLKDTVTQAGNGSGTVQGHDGRRSSAGDHPVADTPTGNLSVSRQTNPASSGDRPFSERGPDSVVEGGPTGVVERDGRPGKTEGTRDAGAVVDTRGDGLQRQGELDPFSSDQIIGDNDKKGKLWWPERHFDQLSQEDRSALYEHLHGRTSPLSEPEFTFDFTEKALPEFTTWTENFAPKFKAMKEYESFVLENKDRFYRLQEQLPDLHIGNHNDQRRLLNEHFKDDHDNLTFINKWLDARDKNANMHWELQAALEPRRQQLEDLANSVVANYRTQNGSLVGIPEIKVEVVAPDKMGSAVATYGDGLLRINQAELLNNKSIADLLGTVYHELTHNEQQSTIIRALADELKVGATISDTDMIPLKKLYQDRTGSSVSDDYMRRVIGLRNGVELPPEAAARARDLAEAFRLNKPVGDEWKKLGNDFRVLQRDLQKLTGNDEPSVAYRIISNLAHTRERDQLATRMFGSTNIPPELTEYIKKFGKHWNGDDDAWTKDTEMAARKAFIKIFEERMNGINNRRRDLYENYMQFHEYDAWLAGERARRAAIANGASHRDPNNSLWQEIDWLQ